MIDAIVLAAGLGTRMGHVKPLIEIDGAPALQRVLGLLRAAAIGRTIVVLGHSADAIRCAVALDDAVVVVNPAPERGLASSLALGIAAVSASARGALVLHADMPFVSEATVRAVVDAAENGARIAAPVYRGERGFPVYFARDCFEGVLDALDGDAGARAYLTAHIDDVTRVVAEDAGCVCDIDSLEDLHREKERHHALQADR